MKFLVASIIALLAGIGGLTVLSIGYGIIHDWLPWNLCERIASLRQMMDILWADYQKRSDKKK